MSVETVNREHAEVARKQWEFSVRWAGELSDKDLRAAKRLRIPGDAGLAVAQESSRRNPLFR